MSSIAHLLEDFGTRQSVAAPSLGEEEIEALRVEGYETGYKAGWEDAVKSQADSTARISEDFARNLQDLSFTYHEAHGHVMQSLAPLLQDLADTLLPEILRETVGFRVVEQLTEMAQANATQTIEITTSLAENDVIRDFLDRDFGFPVSVSVDDTLGEGQVYLRMASEERQIDMQSVMTSIREAIAGILDETERSLKHG